MIGGGGGGGGRGGGGRQGEVIIEGVDIRLGVSVCEVLYGYNVLRLLMK